MADSRKINLYLRPDSKSSQLYSRATKVEPGGNSRQTVYNPPYPCYAKSGYGCRVADEDGQERIDFVNNLTSLIVGHAHPKVVEAVIAQVQKGSAFSWPTESEIRLSEILTDRVESVERVRFTNSGTEAVMNAVKASRAFTGRPKIAKFEGCYHGAYDYVEVSLDPTPEQGGDPRAPKPVSYTRGASPGVLQDVVVLPFNDLEACEAILKKEKGTVAAVIVDPMPNRAGLIPANPMFLPGLREITRRYDMLLIADEVITFRLGYRGTQSVFGFRADLTTFGKVIGGGYPVGAIGGSAEVMSVFDPTGGKPKLPHAGTFNANPVTMVAGAATLELMTPQEYAYLDELGQAARSKLSALFERTGFEAQVSGWGSLFRIIMSRRKLADYRSSLVSAEAKAAGQELFLGLMARGVAITSTLFGSMSTPMTMDEINTLVDAVEDTIGEMKRRRNCLF
ncbi:MAG TPA: aspartate aminotransferase family protein [Thermodesulfobacteriota bacterium]|nr:aspartate aminotransferase family protein [Thermodesulfobacteriota bacterium]